MKRTKLVEQYCQKYNVSDVLRYDVITKIKQECKCASLETLYNMPTDESSLAKIESFKKKCSENMKNLWLFDLLFELQKESIENAKLLATDSTARKLANYFKNILKEEEIKNVTDIYMYSKRR